jgi:hypothetical protein
MTQTGWLDQPQEWRAIPEDDRRFAEAPLKDRLNGIVKAGAAGRSFLLRKVPLSERKRLTNAASDYKRRYGKAGFEFRVVRIPDTDQVGLWTVWKPTNPQSQAAAS